MNGSDCKEEAAAAALPSVRPVFEEGKEKEQGCFLLCLNVSLKQARKEVTHLTVTVPIYIWLDEHLYRPLHRALRISLGHTHPSTSTHTSTSTHPYTHYRAIRKKRFQGLSLRCIAPFLYGTCCL